MASDIISHTAQFIDEESKFSTFNDWAWKKTKTATPIAIEIRKYRKIFSLAFILFTISF
jgi:hypothetical protein